MHKTCLKRCELFIGTKCGAAKTKKNVTIRTLYCNRSKLLHKLGQKGFHSSLVHSSLQGKEYRSNKQQQQKGGHINDKYMSEIYKIETFLQFL